MQAAEFYPGFLEKPMDTDKSSSNGENEAPEMDDGDPRHLLTAEKIVSMREEHMLFLPSKGNEEQMKIYNSLHWVTVLLRIFLLASIAFSAPQWCLSLGDKIDQNCEWIGTEKQVIRSVVPILRSDLFIKGVPVAVCMLVAMRFWKFRLIKYDPIEYKTLMILFIVAVLYIMDYVLDNFNIIGAPYQDIFVILFFMIYVDPIYRCVKRMLGMITIGVDVIILYIVFTIFFAAFNRLMLFDQKGEENSDSIGLHGWENSSTSTFNYAVLVIWNLSPGSNVPDYALKHANDMVGIHWIITIEIFIRQFIIIAITQSTLYFYYQNFYAVLIGNFAEDMPKLYRRIAIEMNDFDGNVNQEVLDEIICKYCENEDHDFAIDEDYNVHKSKYLNAAENSNAAVKAEKKFLNENFSKLRTFRKSLAWKIPLYLSDLGLIICVMVFTEYLYYAIYESTEKYLKFDKDQAKYAENLVGYFKIYDILTYINFVLNLFPLTNIFFRIMTDGFRSMYVKRGNIVEAVAVIGLVCVSIIFMSFKEEFVNVRTFQGLSHLVKAYSILVVLKLIGCVLTYFRQIFIIDILVTVTGKS